MNKHFTCIFTAFFVSMLASVQTATAQYNIPAKMEWWYEARFGMFIHFGSYSYLGEGENAVYIDDWVFDRFEEYQSEVSAKFNPTNFNAGTIAELAKNAGMKYLIITAKHCEGFCMWKTNVQSFTDLTGTKLYSLPDFTEFKDRDILKELKDSCEARGIKFGLYYSFLDWNHKSQIPNRDWYTNMVSFEDRAEYINDMKAQLNELITNYQPAVIWFDGDWTYNDGEPTLSKWWTTTDAIDLYTYLMDLDSTLIVNERIIRGFGLGDFETAEGNVPDKPLSRQWETCRNMNGSWGYNSKKMNNYKTSTELIREMVKTVSRDGNYLLNIGPKGDGTVPKQEADILKKFGEWMSIYSESIYGTTRSPFSTKPSWGYFTKKHDRLYAHIFYWPSSKVVKIPSQEKSINKICMLNDTSTILSYTKSDGSITISLPENAPNSVNSVLMVKYGEPGLTAIYNSPAKPYSTNPDFIQNYSNPFNLSTTFKYRLHRQENVILKIYNLTGQEIETVVNKNQTAGEYEITWQPKGLPGGIYYCRFQAGSFSETKKLILQK